MKKIVFLMIFVLIFSISCAKKAEKPQTEAESEMIMPEGGSVLETQPSSATQAPVTPAVTKDVLTSPIPAATVTVPGKPTAEDIQKALKGAGLYSGSIDGKIGPKTKKAIEEFQSKNGLTADGKVGPKTWEKLKSYLTQDASAVTGNFQ
ncbi:MAG: peptidoglycan-binding domain-containing protein [Candidatus Omnitrophica bacterium]|nr:peptidoglycan-binding domain-containing protein [Candidatus Omnitrophota bacterium]